MRGLGAGPDSIEIIPCTPCNENVTTDVGLSSAVSISKKRKRLKVNTPASVVSVRRSSRQATIANGFRLEAMKDNPQPKKKPRSTKPMPNRAPVTPHTPIAILQQVGRVLEIAEEDISEDKLEASPEAEDKSKQN